MISTWEDCSMPDDSSGQSEQTDQIASTPQVADKPTTTPKTEPQHGDPLMNAMDIPLEVQKQFNIRSESPAPAEAGAQPDPDAEPQPQQPEPEPEGEDEGEDEVEEEAQQPTAEGEQRIDKRQRRINRLTRQKKDLEAQAQQAQAIAVELAQRLQRYEGEEATTPARTPDLPPSGRLSNIVTEGQLDAECAKADAVIEWCDQNDEGVLTGEGENQKFIEPGEIAKWRKEAEKLLLAEPRRREQIRNYTGTKSYFDGIAAQAWPELFDRQSREHQLAQAILKEFPTIKGTPQANYAVGLVIEGMKSVQQRVKGKNGAKPHRDIDERAFAPRVPLAPHTPEPPSRENVRGSSQKRVNEAMSNLIKDVDGSAASLAAVLRAEEEAAGSGRNPRAPIKV
jgi:hypothetical protein